jgi:hypothetical protein
MGLVSEGQTQIQLFKKSSDVLEASAEALDVKASRVGLVGPAEGGVAGTPGAPSLMSIATVYVYVSMHANICVRIHLFSNQISPNFIFKSKLQNFKISIFKISNFKKLFEIERT